MHWISLGKLYAVILMLVVEEKIMANLLGSNSKIVIAVWFGFCSGWFYK